MDGQTDGILGLIAAHERVRVLRQQLWFLTEVRAGVEERARRLQATGQVGYDWCSAAEQGYVAELAAVRRSLDRAARQLAESCESVRSAIAALASAG